MRLNLAFHKIFDIVLSNKNGCAVYEHPIRNDFQKIFKRDVAILSYPSPTGNWSVPQYPSFPILGAWRGFLVWEHLGKLPCFVKPFTKSWFWIGVINFLFCAIFIFIFYIPASSILEAGGGLSVITPRWWTFNFVIWTKLFLFIYRFRTNTLYYCVHLIST